MLSGFSWKSDYLRYHRTTNGSTYYRPSAQRVDLPARINTFDLQRAFPSARGSVTTPSPHRSYKVLRNINRITIAIAIRLILRTRLTPG